MADVTQILSALDQVDSKAAAELLPHICEELRKLAAAHLANEKPGQTLQATALVHEAYIRLVGPDLDREWGGRAHFFSAAAEAMRCILLDAARRKGCQKRGGGMVRLDIQKIDPAAPESSDDLLALDEAIGQLAATDPQAAELVRLRFYAGLPIPEIGRVLGISPRTADRSFFAPIPVDENAAPLYLAAVAVIGSRTGRAHRETRGKAGRCADRRTRSRTVSVRWRPRKAFVRA